MWRRIFLTPVVWLALVACGDADELEPDGSADTDTDTSSDGACVRFVDGNAGSPGDGTSWISPFTDVQAGIDSASLAAVKSAGACMVWVAAGTYHVYQDTAEDTIQLKPDVELYGGFIGDETTLDQRDFEANLTTLDGRSSASDQDRVYHVVTGSDRSLIDGFTIRSGRADGPGFENIRGGGLHFYDGGPITISNCSFVDNEADREGGGLALANSTATISGCEFISNSGTGWGNEGGGAWIFYSNVEMIDCAFTDNQAQSAGGLSLALHEGNTATLQGCDFIGNASTYSANQGRGGGLRIDTVGPPQADPDLTIVDCRLANNTSTGEGGGMYCDHCVGVFSGCEFSDNSAQGSGGGIHLASGGSPLITDSVLAGNHAGEQGGAISTNGASPQIESCVFTDNDASSGGALANVWSGATNLVSCTLTRNSAEEIGGAIYLANGGASALSGCIAWDNEPDDLFAAETSELPQVDYCDIEIGAWGTTNISSDPLFVDPETGDFRLQPGSPCIDAADGSLAPELDIDGNPRWDDPDAPNTGVGPPWVDMGAYEVQPD